MTRLSVCGLGVSCNEMKDTPMLLVVHRSPKEASEELCFPLSMNFRESILTSTILKQWEIQKNETKK